MYFIDCDGTLIDYEDNPRMDVLRAVEEAIARGLDVAIWSGGGANYAKTVVRRLLPELEEGVHYVALGKNWKVLKEGDTVVDDMDFEVPPSILGVDVFPPEGFVELMNEY